MGEENQAANFIFKIIIDRDNGEGFAGRSESLPIVPSFFRIESRSFSGL